MQHAKHPRLLRYDRNRQCPSAPWTALAHICWATALVKLDEMDEAGIVLRPIFDLPPERRISWIDKRMRSISDILVGQPYLKSPLAANLREEIFAYDESDGAA